MSADWILGVGAGFSLGIFASVLTAVYVDWRDQREDER